VSFTFYSNSEEQTLPNKRQRMESNLQKINVSVLKKHLEKVIKPLQDRSQSGNMEQQNNNLELEYQQARKRTFSKQKLQQVCIELYLCAIYVEMLIIVLR
jgi:hypothetical protein